jgi:hypothetical protein
MTQELTLALEPDLTLAQQKIQNLKMVNFDSVLCHTALGTIASLQYDIAQIHAQFKMALQAANSSGWIAQLYATALNNISLPFEASDLLLEYQTHYPNELSLLRDTIKSCVNTGRAFRGEALLAQWHKLTDIQNPYETKIKQWAFIYRHQSLPESEVQLLLETALSLIHQSLIKQRHHFLIAADYANYDGAPYLSYTIYLELPVDDLLELEEQHNHLLSYGNFNERLLDNIIITFEHLAVEEKYNELRNQQINH